MHGHNGQWSPPETIFFKAVATATDETNGYVDASYTNFNQDRIRILAMTGLCSNRITRAVFTWYSHDVLSLVPFHDGVAIAVRSVIFQGSPNLEVYPCDRLVARFYAPLNTDEVYCNATIQRYFP